MPDFRVSGIEHGRFSSSENRTSPIFDLGTSNMALTWPIFGFGKSNMADFWFSVIEHGRFSDFGNRTWPMFDFRVLNIAKSCNSLTGNNSETICSCPVSFLSRKVRLHTHSFWFLPVSSFVLYIPSTQMLLGAFKDLHGSGGGPSRAA